MGRFTLDDILGGACIAIMLLGLPWVAAIAQAVMQ
jgi:hypothetical protein